LPVLNINSRIGSFSDSPKTNATSRAGCVKPEYYKSNNQSLASLELKFTKKELITYTEFR
jgi:hypothetical protein